MRPHPNPKVERYRVTEGPLGSKPSNGVNGAYLIPCPGTRANLYVIASDGLDLVGKFAWEHISISLKTRMPTWTEMAYVKDLFWDDEETVIQIHPPKSQYVNCHPLTLHLWRPLFMEIPLPPTILVGPKD